MPNTTNPKNPTPISFTPSLMECSDSEDTISTYSSTSSKSSTASPPAKRSKPKAFEIKSKKTKSRSSKLAEKPKAISRKNLSTSYGQDKHNTLTKTQDCEKQQSTVATVSTSQQTCNEKKEENGNKRKHSRLRRQFALPEAPDPSIVRRTSARLKASAPDCDYYGVDNETKRALKASMETYKQESSTRQMIFDANTRLPIQTRRARNNSSFSFKEFERLWKYCEENLGVTTAEIEHGSMVRGANHSNTTSAASSSSSASFSFTRSASRKKSTYSSSQSNAQYGRILFPAMKKIAEITRLAPGDIFLDIGHGIGNAALQCAFTIGCESRGVEIVPERCRIAEQFRDILFECVGVVATEEGGRRRNVGRVEFREGCLKSPDNRKFITDANVVLVNNAHDIFGTRSVDRDDGTPTLDTHVGSLFACMKPGTRMVTLHPLLCLGRSLLEENEKRSNNGLEESIDASFFLSEKRYLGKGSVSWSDKDVCIYVYTRVHQSNPDGTAVFLCANLKCPWKSPTVAVDENGLLQDTCIYCDTRRIVKTRKRN